MQDHEVLAERMSAESEVQSHRSMDQYMDPDFPIEGEGGTENGSTEPQVGEGGSGGGG